MQTSNSIMSKQVRGRFLLLAPVVAIPFVLLFFWKMGVGKDLSEAPRTEEDPVFPAGLPDIVAHKGENLNKLEHYEKADRDSQRLKELIRHDPYYLEPQGPIGYPDGDPEVPAGHEAYDFTPIGRQSGEQLSQEIFKKLSDLQQELESPATRRDTDRFFPFDGHQGATNAPKKEMLDLLDAHEAHLDSLSSDPSQDMEILQLNAMLDKVLDIQHPDRLRSRAQHEENLEGVGALPVGHPLERAQISVLAAHGHERDTFRRAFRFYSLNDQGKLPPEQGAIPAAVHGRQELIDGSYIKLHLMETVNVAGKEVPKGALVFGQVRFSPQRMDIKIKHLRVGRSILPVDMQVHDLDGLPGVHVPGDILRQGIQESADRSVQELGMPSLDPSWETKAASLGVQAAKRLMAKRIKVKKVIMPADYRVLLFDKKKTEKINKQ